MNKFELQAAIEAKQSELTEKQKEIDSFDKSDYFSHDDYREHLNECYGYVNVCGMEYAAGCALQELDPVAFRCGFNDWVDSQDEDEIDAYKELKEELESLEDELSDLQSEWDDLEDE